MAQKVLANLGKTLQKSGFRDFLGGHEIWRIHTCCLNMNFTFNANLLNKHWKNEYLLNCKRPASKHNCTRADWTWLCESIKNDRKMTVFAISTSLCTWHNSTSIETDTKWITYSRQDYTCTDEETQMLWDNWEHLNDTHKQRWNTSNLMTTSYMY